MHIRIGRAVALTVAGLAFGLFPPQRAAAQGTPAVENVELEPITCYWRTSTDAVRLGETFTLVLTCGVLDTAATTVVPDQSRLDPGALQLQPFEVTSGSQAPDLRTPARRFFQYEYQLRYVGEEVGRDLQLPALTLSYRVQSRVQQDGAAVEGREQQYILPAHTLRILSVVPAAARDIRDGAPVTLAGIDAQRFRASMLRLSSTTLYVLGAVVALWGSLAAVRRRRGVTRTVVRHATDASVLSGVLRELSAVRRARTSDGWTDSLAARALAALRVAASYDAGLHVAQTQVRHGVPILSGQLRLPAVWPRMTEVVVSGAATAVLLARTREGNTDSNARRARLDDLESALTRFSEVAYGRPGAASDDALDESLTAAERATAAIRREHSWLATQFRALRHKTVERVRTRGWQRS